MRYSDIEKCCNSLRPKVPSLHVQSCLREVTALLRLNRWNRSLSRGCSCGSTSTLVPTLPISEVCSGGSRGRAQGARPPFIFRRKWGPEGRQQFFWGRAPLISGSGWPPPPPLSEGLDPPLVSVCCEHHRASAPRTLPFCITGHGILTTNALAW